MNYFQQTVLRRLESYRIAILSNRLRLWDIPIKVRRGTHCRELYVAACRYTRDSGSGFSRFFEDFQFLRKELVDTEGQEQYERLLRADEYMRDTSRRMYAYDLPEPQPYWSYPRSLILLEKLKRSKLPKTLGLSPKQFVELSLNDEFREEVLTKVAEIAQKHMPRNSSGE